MEEKESDRYQDWTTTKLFETLQQWLTLDLIKGSKHVTKEVADVKI